MLFLEEHVGRIIYISIGAKMFPASTVIVRDAAY